jgi:hypothetical protein
MTQKLLLFCVMLLALPGCMLDRSALGCPEGSMYEPGGSLCVPLADADSPDGSLPLDGGVDAWIPDGDAGPLPDAWIDPDGGVDAGTDAGGDGGRDAGPPPPDAGMRRCEDTTEGYCFRFTSLADSPEVTDWMIQFIWTLPGGSIYRLPDNRDPDGIAVYAPACDVFRRIDARTTECEIAYPDPGMATISAGPYYAYPTYASGPACTSTGCPAYSAGYRMWSSGVEFSTAPGDGRVSQESRPTSAGTIIVLRIIP